MVTGREKAIQPEAQLTVIAPCGSRQREPRAQEIGRAARDIEGVLVVEVRRGGRRIGCWQDKGIVIEPGDRLLVIDSDAVVAGTA